MQKHVRMLGVLYLVYGCLCALCCLLLVFVRVRNVTGAPASTIVATPETKTADAVVTALLLLIYLPTIVAGIGLLKYKNWARVLTIVLSVLHILSIPFGTALAIYALWVLLSDETKRVLGAALLDSEGAGTGKG